MNPEITERRQLDFESAHWTVNEFDHGQRYMLIATADNGRLQFSAHFDATQWDKFQELVSP